MNSLKSAKALFLQGKLDQAEFLFLKNLEIEEEAETFLFLGMIQVQKKDYESAYHFLIKCIEKNPDDGNACNELGVVCLREGKEKEAVYWLKRAVLSLKNDARHVSLYNLAILYKIWNRPGTLYSIFTGPTNSRTGFQGRSIVKRRITFYLKSFLLKARGDYFLSDSVNRPVELLHQT